MKGKKISFYLLLFGIVYLIGTIIYKMYSTDNAEYIIFIAILMLLLFSLILFVRIKYKNEYKRNRLLYFFVLFSPIISIFIIQGYRHYFMITERNYDAKIESGQVKEIRVYGTAHQPKLFEMIITKDDKNHFNSSLQPDWINDTTWTYYNSSGEQVEKSKFPKIYPKYYFLNY